MARIRKTVKCYLCARVRREGAWYVSEMLGLPITSQGETESEAMASLIEAAALFIDSCARRGKLEQVLLKYNWRPCLRPPVEFEEGTFVLPFPVDPVVAKRALECLA